MNERKSVREYFGLTYANYYVMHRTLLEAMPAEWQDRFVRLLDEYDDAWEHLSHYHSYPQFKVETGRWASVENLSIRDLDRLGIVSSVQVWLENNPEPKPEEYEDDDDYTAVYELWSDDRDAQFDNLEFIDAEGSYVTHSRFFLPLSDKIDHYRHPRKYSPYGKTDE